MATVYPNDDYDVEAACKDLKDAMDGLGTNEKLIIKTLTAHSNEQRLEIEKTFKGLFGEDLMDSLKSELGGDFEDAVVAFMAAPRVFDARELRNAMQGAGTTESTIIEILCTKTNTEIEEIKTAYNKEFERDLEEDLKSETSGNFERLLVSLVTGARDEEEDVDEDKAHDDAQEIYDAGEGQCGTDETAFNSVLCRRGLCQLNETFNKYADIAGRDIEEAISSECSGTLEDGYLAIVKAAKDMPSFFAERLNDALAGAGTKDNQLIRIIVARSEIDLADIKDRYQEKYERSLGEAIEGDCGGDYKRFLLAVAGEASE